MHHILARITVKPEFADAARDILVKLAAESRKESGCEAYALYQQAEAPHVFQTVERWKAKADVDAHMATPHVDAAIAAATAMFATPPEIVAWTQLA